MTQVLKPTRVSKSLLLAALLLVPAIAVLGPVEAQVPGQPPVQPPGAPTCTSLITKVTTTPTFADVGETVRVTVVIDTTPDGATGPVNLHLVVTAPASTSAVLDQTYALNAPTTKTVTFTAPSGSGLGDIQATLLLQTSNPTQTNYCNPTANPTQGQGSMGWGYWVGVKPDLQVAEATVVQHYDGDQGIAEPSPPGHADEGDKINFTRYPSVAAPSTTPCQEQTAQSPSRVHLKIELHNEGDAGFWVHSQNATNSADAQVALPLRIRLLDGFLPVGSFLGDVYPVSVDAGKGVTFVLAMSNYSMLNRVGDRALKVIVDSDATYNETNEANNDFTKEFHIAAPDLTGEWVEQPSRDGNGLKGTVRMKNIGEHRAGAAEASGATETVNICTSRDGGPVWARVYVDVADKAHQIYEFSDTLDPDKSSADKPFTSNKTLKAGTHSIVLMTDAATAADLASNANELNETNNRVLADTVLTVPDVDTPIITNLTNPATGRVNEALNISGNLSDDADFAATDQNHLFVNITYPDTTNHVFVVVNNPQNPAASGVVEDSQDSHAYNFWWNSSYPMKGIYSYVIEAQDSVHRVLSAAHAFDLSEFPKNVAQVVTRVCENVVNGEANPPTASITCDYNHTSFIPTKLIAHDDNTGASLFNGNLLNLTFQVPAGATGLASEFKNIQRKRVTLWDPDGNAVGNFTVNTVCWNTQTAGGNANITEAVQGCQELAPLPNGDPNPGSSVFPCSDTTINCYNFTFRAVMGIGQGGVEVQPNGVLGNADLGCVPASSGDAAHVIHLNKPGPWNVTMWVGDAASPCVFRANGVPDTPLYTFELWSAPNTTITQVTPGASSNVNALTPAVMRANLTVNTTAGPLKQAVVEVFRANGTQDDLVGSFDMIHPTGTYLDDANRTGIYQVTLSTGLGNLLDQAGTYRWRIGVKDANHTWAYSNGTNPPCVPSITGCVPQAFTLRVDDTRLPSVVNAIMSIAGAGGVEATQVQGGTNLTAEANVDDDTRITVEAVIQSEGGTEVLRLPMARRSEVSTVYATENITTGAAGDLPEGAYRLVVHAVDSAGNAVDSPARAFAVVGNLGPSFSNFAPVPGGFGALSGTITVDVSDPLEGVPLDAIAVRIGTSGTATEPVLVLGKTPLDTASPPKSVRVSFAVPSQVAHGANVTVNVTAHDGGTPPMPSSVQWAFVVDGQAPRATVTCAPSFPAACGNAGQQVAIRGDSVISFAATDADPIAESGVRAIRYTIETTGQAPATVEVPGANATLLLGGSGRPDGTYTIRYQAIDFAGNGEERSFAVNLDTQGPQVQNILRTQTPDGANVSAVITDLGVADVQRATLFFRTDVQGYQPAAMTRIGDTRGWYAELTNARRGTRVCYYLEAQDFLNNTGANGSSIAPECFSAENHPPRLEVLAPHDGESVGSSLSVRWDTGDIDGDPVTVALGIRRVGDVQLRAIPLSIEEQGRHIKTFTTTDLVAGTYQLRVDATDNQPFNNRTSTVLNLTIGGGGATSGLPVFDRSSVDIGQRVRVSVQLTKPVADIQAQLQRDNRVVDRAPMDQEPAGGSTYVAEFIIRDPGVYRVVVVGTYEDGTPFEIASSNTLTVRGGGLGLDAVVIGGLAVVVVALAVVGMRRRGA